MSDSGRVEPLWAARLRWRMRGAWLWPTFAVVTIAEGWLLYLLPPWEGGPRSVLAGLLLAGFANLFCVAVMGPLAGRWLRRRHPAMPRAVADNYAGTASICGLALILLIAGAVHRPVVAAEQADRRAQLGAVHDYVLAQAPDFRAGLSQVDSIQIESQMYRSCVPGPDPQRWLCLYVQTDQSPPGLRLDPDRTPNSAYRRGGGFQ